MGHDARFRKLVAAAVEFHRARPWEAIHGSAPLVVVIPTEEHPVEAYLSDGTDGSFGLVLLMGNTLEDDESDGDEDAESMDVLGFSLLPLGGTPAALRSMLKSTGISSGRDDLVPWFYRKKPGRMPRNPDAKESRTLLYAINAVLVAHRRGVLRAVEGADGKITIAVDGAPENPGVTVEFETFRSVQDPELEDPGSALADLPALDVTWAVGLPELPFAVTGERRVTSALVVAEVDTGRTVTVRSLSRRNVTEAAELLFGAMAGRNPIRRRGLPRRLLVQDRELLDAVTPLLEPLGVACTPVKDHELLRKIRDEWMQNAPECGDPIDLRNDEVPADDDLEGWKGADHLAIRLRSRTIVRDRLVGDETLAAYFGDAEVGKAMLRKYEHWSVLPSFFEWLAHGHRSGPRGDTVAERMLKGAPPAAVRSIMQSRGEHVPSIFRVKSVEAGSTATFVDLVTGATRKVHDRALSLSVKPDLFLPAWIYPAGAFWFITCFGPPLNAWDVHPAIRFLEGLGLEMTPAGIARRSHLFGRLWKWVDDLATAPRRVPRLKNTDGDDFVSQKAVFAVKRPDTLRAALARRKSIDADRESDEYVWLRPATKRKNILGGPTVLARMQIIGEELILEVNSEARLAKAREWIERIPGVSFRGASAATPRKSSSAAARSTTGCPTPDPPCPRRRSSPSCSAGSASTACNGSTSASRRSGTGRRARRRSPRAAAPRCDA